MERRIAAPVVAAAACAVCIFVVAFFAFEVARAESFDAHTLARLSAPADGIRSALANAVARLADPLPVLLMTAAMIGFALLRRRNGEAVAALVVVLGANLTTLLLKGLLAHPRFDALPGYNQPWPNSFPSGHETAAASIGIALVLVAPPRLRPLATAVAVGFVGAVGLAVVVAQWHYPSDVIGGLLVASAWGFAALAALRARERRREGGGGAQAIEGSVFAISTK
jgi:membrane-associated phospholipid phosphatase